MKRKQQCSLHCTVLCNPMAQVQLAPIPDLTCRPSEENCNIQVQFKLEKCLVWEITCKFRMSIYHLKNTTTTPWMNQNRIDCVDVYWYGINTFRFLSTHHVSLMGSKLWFILPRTNQMPMYYQLLFDATTKYKPHY